MARVLVVSFSVVPGPDRHGVQMIHILKALASRFTVDVLTLRVGDLAYVERFQKTRHPRIGAKRSNSNPASFKTLGFSATPQMAVAENPSVLRLKSKLFLLAR